MCLRDNTCGIVAEHKHDGWLVPTAIFLDAAQLAAHSPLVEDHLGQLLRAVTILSEQEPPSRWRAVQTGPGRWNLERE